MENLLSKNWLVWSSVTLKAMSHFRDLILSSNLYTPVTKPFFICSSIWIWASPSKTNSQKHSYYIFYPSPTPFFKGIFTFISLSHIPLQENPLPTIRYCAIKTSSSNWRYFLVLFCEAASSPSNSFFSTTYKMHHWLLSLDRRDGGFLVYQE